MIKTQILPSKVVFESHSTAINTARSLLLWKVFPVLLLLWAGPLLAEKKKMEREPLSKQEPTVKEGVREILAEEPTPEGMISEEEEHVSGASPVARMQGLEIESEGIEEAQELEGVHFQKYVMLKGKYVRPLWDLYWEGQKVKLDEGGEFKLKVPIYEKMVSVEFIAKGPAKEMEKETLDFWIPEWRLLEGPGDKEKPLKRFSITPAVGLQTLLFSQTNRSNFFMTSADVRVSGFYILLPPSWLANFSFGITALPLVSSGGTGQPIRFLDGEISIGASAPFVNRPWELRILLGVYYNTMLLADATYGYRNSFSPVFTPAGYYRFNNGDVAFAYFKLGTTLRRNLATTDPTSTSLSRTLGVGKLSLGGGWIHALNAKRSFTLSGELSNFQYDLPTENTGYSSLMVNFGYRF